MDRTQKAQFVEEIRTQFENAPFVALTNFQGSTVEQMNELRRACEPIGVTYRVVKNTLCRRALEGMDQGDLASYFTGNIGVVFSGEDPIAAAKMVRDQVKANKNLEVRAGYFEGEILDADAVNKVADLPSREELLSMLLRTIQEGPRQVLGVISGTARDLQSVLGNYAAKLEEDAA